MADKVPVVLAVDIGGSHVKIMSSAGGVEAKAVSGPAMDASGMCEAVLQLATGMDYDVLALGYPGPVVHNHVLCEPHNLAP
jgi:polyphosphate glucokinase